jgi:hypothetical protein
MEQMRIMMVRETLPNADTGESGGSGQYINGKLPVMMLIGCF